MEANSGPREEIEPIPPSCRNANESSPLGFVMLEGRGGGDAAARVDGSIGGGWVDCGDL